MISEHAAAGIWRSQALLAVSALVAASACAKREEPEKSTPPAAIAAAVPERIDPRVEARNVFTARCTVCHGNSGEGNGPGAAALDPKPRNFKDGSWQASVDDAHIGKIIVGGGPAVKLSPLMPGNPDLAGKPEVVTELVNMVRKFKP